MRRLLLVLLLLAPARLEAQSSAATARLTTTGCPGQGCVILDAPAGGTAAVRVTGTWTGTLVFEAALEQSDYFPIEGTPPVGQVAAVTSTTANGVWVLSVAGYRSFRVRAQTITGEALVTVRVSSPSHVVRTLGATSGGGASGGLTNTELRAAPVPVSGTFFQATQPVSGTVAVSNLPATQPVSGSVSVTNFPATQPVSIAAMPTTAVTGPLTDAQLRAQALPVSGTVGVNNFPSTTSVSNFPALQATREVTNTGRTLIGLSYTATAPTTADTVVTGLVKASAGVAAAGAQSILPAASKTLRLFSASVGIRTTTAALPWVLVTLRVSNTTTCAATSSVLAYLPAGGTAAVIGNVGQAVLAFPDGLEIPAGGSACLSVSGNVTTNVLTFSAQGFEY